MSLTELDTGIEQFMIMLFRSPVMPPFSFFIDLSGIMPDQILGPLLCAGAQSLYNKQLSNLTEPEIGVLREYLLSIGWDADYHLATLYKEVVDYRSDGEPYVNQIKVNNWQITFKTADHSLRTSNAGCNSSNLI